MIIDAQTELLSFFEKNDSFIPDKDFDKIIPISENRELDLSVFISALNLLEKSQIVIRSEDNRFWTLLKPIQQYNQNITLSYQTVSSIAAIVNDFCHKNDITDALVNPMNIQEKDIQSLIILLNKKV